MALSPAYEKHPEHTLAIDDHRVGVRVSIGEIVVAETTRGLSLREGRSPPVVYVPREDVFMDRLRGSDHSTHCPFKGDASYFDFTGAPSPIEQVAWSYEDPFDQVAAIRDHLAFYADRVRIEMLGD